MQTGRVSAHLSSFKSNENETKNNGETTLMLINNNVQHATNAVLTTVCMLYYDVTAATADSLAFCKAL